MTFLPNIPQPNDNLDFSQPQLLQNNQALDAWGDINHFKPSDSSLDKGKHKYVQIPSSTVPPATGATEWAIYTNTIATKLEIFVQPPNATTAYQLTASRLAPLSSANGVSYLPGGTYIQWGSSTSVTNSGSTNIVFPVPFPTAVFSVQGTVVTNDSSTVRFSLLNDATLTGFTTTQTSTSHFTRLYWIAIGN